MTDYVLLKLSSMISDYAEEILGRMFANYESVYKSSVDDFLSKNSKHTVFATGRLRSKFRDSQIRTR